MIDKATISNPKTHYGSGKHATRHFVLQRLTGAINLVFVLFFVWFVMSVAGADRAGMIATIANVAIHMRLGMLEVIEDYVDDERTNRLTRTVNDVFTILVAVVAAGSIAKIVFWG